MSQINSGEGMPDVVQKSSTLSFSILVTLDGLRVAIGTSTYKERAGKKESVMEMERGEEGGVKRSELRIPDQLLFIQLKHRARNKLNKECGGAAKHTPSRE